MADPHQKTQQPLPTTTIFPAEKQPNSSTNSKRKSWLPIPPPKSDSLKTLGLTQWDGQVGPNFPFSLNSQ